MAPTRIRVIERSVAEGRGTVFLLPFAETPEETLLAAAGLAVEDRERYARFPAGATQRRKEWLATRVLVRERWGGRVEYTASGQPILADAAPDVRISISHTVGWAALMAVSGRSCGVDIEAADRTAIRTIDRIASPEELKLAEALFPTNPALLVWCAKEAAYKALGRVGMDFRTQILLKDFNHGTRLFSIAVASERMQLEFFEENGLLCVCGTH